MCMYIYIYIEREREIQEPGVLGEGSRRENGFVKNQINNNNNNNNNNDNT